MFTNVQGPLSGDWCVLRTRRVPLAAWHFGTFDGYQDFFGKNAEFYAVAVRPGDVAAAVSEPQTLALALLALGAAVVARRRRPH